MKLSEEICKTQCVFPCEINVNSACLKVCKVLVGWGRNWGTELFYKTVDGKAMANHGSNHKKRFAFVSIENTCISRPMAIAQTAPYQTAIRLLLQMLSELVSNQI